MPKVNRTRNLNFRQTKSERSANQSYRGFGKFIKRNISKLIKKTYK